MAQRPQPSLRFADGGSFITRWAQSVMRAFQTVVAQLANSNAETYGKAASMAMAGINSLVINED